MDVIVNCWFTTKKREREREKKEKQEEEWTTK